MLIQHYLRSFLLFAMVMDSHGQLHLYRTKEFMAEGKYDYDCFDIQLNYDIPEDFLQSKYMVNYEITSFCRRDNIDDGVVVATHNIPVFTFDELYRLNVSGNDLLQWSTSIDLVEEYEAFRETKNRQESTISNLLFYNCSVVNRFGQYCQYDFGISVS